MKSKDKPYILYVAEKIYLEVSEIKKKNKITNYKHAQRGIYSHKKNM